MIVGVFPTNMGRLHYESESTSAESRSTSQRKLVDFALKVWQLHQEATSSESGATSSESGVIFTMKVEQLHPESGATSQ